MIAQFVEDQHRDWDERLDALQFAINTARQEATGYTPAFLMHGRELARPYPQDRRPTTDTQTLEEGQQCLEEAYELVRIHLARAFQRQETHYNLRRREWQPRLGDKVWKRDRPLSSKADAFSAKLAPKFVGPMEVRKIMSPVIVDQRDAQRKWHREVHVQDLKTTAPAKGNDAETALGSTGATTARATPEKRSRRRRSKSQRRRRSPPPPATGQPWPI